MNNQQREAEASNEDSQVSRLEQQLHEASLASDFFEHQVGKLFIQYAAAIVNRNTKDMLSKKFINDHEGYINARAEAAAIQELLRRMQVSSNPERVARIKDIVDGTKSDSE